MAKVSSTALKVCDWIIKYSIYSLVFLVPILFLPWTSDVLDFNKQTLLVLLGFVAIFAWMLKVLISGKIELNNNKINIVVGVLFLIYLFSSIFSINSYGSFWGWPQSSSESLLTLISLLLVYFLISSHFSKKNIFTSIIVFSFSALIAQIIGILQLFGLFIIPFGFTKSISFNTIGSIGSLGFFVAILLPLFIILIIISKKWWKILFGVEIFLSALILIAINYQIVWWAVILGSAMIMIFGVLKRNLFDGRWMALPMFFLAVSLFFVLLSPQIPVISRGVNEIFLSHGASLQIGLQAIKERPIFGSGLGTFSYDFLKFKDVNFSNSPLWSTIFNTGSSEILSSLATGGFLGFIALLALIILPVFFGIRFLVGEKISKQDLSGEKETSRVYWILTLGLVVVSIVLALLCFLYNFNVTLIFTFFFALACLVGMISQEKKEYELKPSSLLTLIVTFVFTLVFIFGLGLLILDGQRYIAEVNYYNGLASWSAGNADAGTKNLLSAVNLNSSSDLYLRQLSQAYLLLLQKEMQNVKEVPSDEEKNKVQAYFASAVNAAKMATTLNPKNSGNWSNLGYVYQSLNGLVGDTSTWSIGAYEEALKLDPNNPYLFSQEGAVNFISAMTLSQENANQKGQLLATAKDKLEKAVALNPSYLNALYSLGLVYDALGQKDKAIAEFEKVQQLNPQDTTIPKILDNLNAGRSALQTTTPLPVETPPETPTGDNAVKNSPETIETTTPVKTTPKTTK